MAEVVGVQRLAVLPQKAGVAGLFLIERAYFTVVGREQPWPQPQGQRLGLPQRPETPHEGPRQVVALHVLDGAPARHHPPPAGGQKTQAQHFGPEEEGLREAPTRYQPAQTAGQFYRRKGRVQPGGQRGVHLQKRRVGAGEQVLVCGADLKHGESQAWPLPAPSCTALGSTLPGLRCPSGSSACFTSRSTASVTGSMASAMKANFMLPMPCSPLSTPP